jgi:hypothetical protein
VPPSVELDAGGNRKGAPLRGIEMFDRDHRDLGPSELLRRQNPAVAPVISNSTILSPRICRSPLFAEHEGILVIG